MKTNTLMPVIKAILNDEEFLCGGIFTKEKQYAKKYDLTMEEIGNIQTCLYYEPLSALDAETRSNMQLLIMDLHRLLDNTVIMVTHSESEAKRMCDEILKF